MCSGANFGSGDFLHGTPCNNLSSVLFTLARNLAKLNLYIILLAISLYVYMGTGIVKIPDIFSGRNFCEIPFISSCIPAYWLLYNFVIQDFKRNKQFNFVIGTSLMTYYLGSVLMFMSTEYLLTYLL